MVKVPHILFITDNFPPRRGGISRVVELMCRAMPPDRISVIAPWSQRNHAVVREADRTRPFRVLRVRYPGLEGGLPLVLASLGNLATAVSGYCMRRRPDWVVFGKVWPVSLISPLLDALGIPYVFYCHGRDFLKPVAPFMERRRLASLHGARALMANSSYVKGKLVEKGLPAERVTVVNPKVDLAEFEDEVDVEAFRQRKDAEERLVLLTVGRLVSFKRQNLVIRAVARLRDRFPQLLYVVMGDGPNGPHLHNEVQRLGVEEHVWFVDDSERAEWYRACDAFVMPSAAETTGGAVSSVETFGIVFIEANICGKPVVASNCGGIPDAVVDGENGLVVQPDDEEGLVQALDRLLSDPDLRERLGRQGKERAQRLFGYERLRDELLEVLRKAEAGE
jgi:phosphatidylinositol alpha-1,6-mannosyltransferase